MSMVDLITGSRMEVGSLASDPRMRRAEEALRRFIRSGTVREASAFATALVPLAYEVIRHEFPAELQREVCAVVGPRLLVAATAASLNGQPEELVWALAHELRSLAAAYDLPIEHLRPVRRTGGEPRRNPLLEPERMQTLATEILRAAGGWAALHEIQTILGLSTAELASLFGVSRQAVDQWYQSALPAGRIAEVERVRDVARVLYEELIPERIPQVVRSPARGLRGHTILQVLAQPEGADQVRAYLGRLYSFAAA